MLKNYAKNFGISDQLLKCWRGRDFFLPGNKDKLIVLVHGWSLLPRQVKPLAKVLNRQGYSVLAPRLSGHGTKPEDLENVSWHDWVHNVVEAIQKTQKIKGVKKVIVGGVSMGGNACLLASLEEKVDGIILIGTPVYLKNHLIMKIVSVFGPLFKKYIKKKRPTKVFFRKEDSYQYFPIKNSREVLQLIKQSVKQLKRVTAPILILQTKNDFFVTKYSPWIIYKNVSSKIKEIKWIHTDSENHVPQGEEVGRTAEVIVDFVRKI